MTPFASSRRTPPRVLWRAARSGLVGALALSAAQAAASPLYDLTRYDARFCGANSARADSDAGRYIGGGPRGDAPLDYAVKLDIVEEELGDGLQAVRNCGATYIGGGWLVTAAHCLDDGAYMRIEALARAAHIDDPDALKQVSVEAICHADFDRRTMRNDIALIRLPQELPSSIPAAPLSKDLNRAPSGLAFLTGWRRTRAGDIAARARKAFLSLGGRQQTNMILARPQQGAYESPCIGESGSGLMRSVAGRSELIGVFSAVEAFVAAGDQDPNVQNCDSPDTRLIFTPVADHLAWIDAVRAVCDADPRSCGFSGPARAATPPIEVAYNPPPSNAGPSRAPVGEIAPSIQLGALSGGRAFPSEPPQSFGFGVASADVNAAGGAGASDLSAIYSGGYNTAYAAPPAAAAPIQLGYAAPEAPYGGSAAPYDIAYAQPYVAPSYTAPAATYEAPSVYAAPAPSYSVAAPIYEPALPYAAPSYAPPAAPYMYQEPSHGDASGIYGVVYNSPAPAAPYMYQETQPAPYAAPYAPTYSGYGDSWSPPSTVAPLGTGWQAVYAPALYTPRR